MLQPKEESRPSRGLAYIYGVGRNKMMEAFRDAGILSKQNLPTPLYKGRGWFEVKKAKGFDVMTTYWTPAGIEGCRTFISHLPKVSPPRYIPDHNIEMINPE